MTAREQTTWTRLHLVTIGSPCARPGVEPQSAADAALAADLRAVVFDRVAAAPGDAARARALEITEEPIEQVDPRLGPLAEPGDAGDVRAALAELARGTRDGEVLVVADGAALAAAVAIALGLAPGGAATSAGVGAGPPGPASPGLAPSDPASTDPVRAAPVWAAIDWPVPEAARARPKLAGLDLDWRPPRASGGREGFPGGPGTGR